MVGFIGAVVGSGGATFQGITDRTVSRAQLGTCTSTYTVGNDGVIRNHAGTALETWILPGSASSSYEVRATYQSGTQPSGTYGSWLLLDTSRSWSQVNSAGDDSTVSGVILIELRPAGGSVVDSASITIAAQSLGL